MMYDTIYVCCDRDSERTSERISERTHVRRGITMGKYRLVNFRNFTNSWSTELKSGQKVSGGCSEHPKHRIVEYRCAQSGFVHP